MRTVELDPSEYQPRPPAQRDFGIGIVGCGGIAQSAHLPAYRRFGYRVVACCDIRPEAAEAARNAFGIPFATTDIDALLARDDVEIVDLAVHASQRLPLVEKIAAAGKPILSQKPFALNLADAERMVAVCEKAGVPLMINQQARWAPAHRAAKLLIERGVLGHVYSVLHLNRSFQDVPGSWYVKLEHFNIIDHGIHYIDLARYFTGRMPVRVKATTAMVPGQAAVTPMIYTILCEYEPADQLMTTLHFNNIVQTSALHRYEWFIDGTEGSLAVSHSELTISFKDAPWQRQSFAIRGQWFPDAFGGSRGEMMQALSEKREPATSGRDNLQSIRIAYAAVESAETGRAVALR
ncbi:MAG TPA: Gfo/Idh/MocA family oxidoreductase [Limnochordia bacterium]